MKTLRNLVVVAIGMLSATLFAVEASAQAADLQAFLHLCLQPCLLASLLISRHVCPTASTFF
jgi:hypothetical protein